MGYFWVDLLGALGGGSAVAFLAAAFFAAFFAGAAFLLAFFAGSRPISLAARSPTARVWLAERHLNVASVKSRGLGSIHCAFSLLAVLANLIAVTPDTEPLIEFFPRLPRSR